MRNCLTEKEIDSFVSGLSSKKDKVRVETHISTCPDCRKLIASLTDAVTAHPVDIVPGPHVRERVISEWHKINASGKEKSSESSVLGYSFFAGLGVAAAALAVIAVVFILPPFMNSKRSYPLVLSQITGEVRLNGRSPEIKKILENGDRIQTAAGNAELRLSGVYTLRIEDNTSIEIIENSIRGVVSFSLNSGNISSVSSGFSSYRFECGGFSFIPVGTAFTLSKKGPETVISVLDGKVLVTGNKVRAIVSKGQSWSSENPDRISKTGDSRPSDITFPKEQTKKIIRRRHVSFKPENSNYEENTAIRKGDVQSDENRERNRLEKRRVEKDLLDSLNRLKKMNRTQKGIKQFMKKGGKKGKGGKD